MDNFEPPTEVLLPELFRPACRKETLTPIDTHPVARAEGTAVARKRPVDPDRIECDACPELATDLNFRKYDAEHCVSLRVCPDHDRLSNEYKLKGSPDVKEEKKEKWLDSAPKIESHAVAEELMSPDRGEEYDHRKLTWRERRPNRDGRDRQDLGRDIGL